jgi:uncharacterized protein YutE (UPF0331/DUF86 family)
MDYRSVSPMLRHALESFEHGICHYLDGTDLGRKLALLHVDHAVELIIKEKLVRMGKSIFKSDGKTLNVHEAFTSLDREVSLPERPRLEDLHDLRNTVQHKGLSLDEFTTGFYVTEAYNFVKRFLNDELDIELKTYLPRSFVRTMEGIPPIPSNLTEEAQLRLKEAENLYSSGAYEMAIVAAYVALEITLREMVKDRKATPFRLFDELRATRNISDETWHKFRKIADLRNRSVHTAVAISKEEARNALDDLNELMESLPDSATEAAA